MLLLHSIIYRNSIHAQDQSLGGEANYNRTMNLQAHEIEIIGYCAAFLTTIAFLPQAIHSWRTRNLSGVSLGMYSLFTAGVGLWLIYGLVIEKWPLIFANAITFALALSILVLKLRHTSKDRK
jgi:MtN3 and saliva related transmembrane protein